jgi:HEAT repeat protein
VGRLLEDPDAQVRAAALWPLKLLEDPRWSDRAAALTADPDHRVRLAAIDVFRGTVEAVDARVKLLRDPSPLVREAAAQSVCSLGKPHLMLPLLRDPDLSVVVAALDGLAGEEGDGLVERVLPLLKHRDGAVRAAAVRASADLDASPATLQLMLRDPDPRVRASTVRALSKHPEALRLFDDASAEVRVAAVRHVRGVEGALPWLVVRLEDEHPEVRAEAVCALTDVHGDADKTALSARVVKLLTDRHVDVRSAALRALAAWRAKQYRAEVRARLRDDEPLIVWQARNMLEEWEGAHDVRMDEA